MINFETLLAQKEEQYNNLTVLMQQTTEQYKADMAEIENERFRIQGEYRLLASFIEEQAATGTGTTTDAETVAQTESAVEIKETVETEEK